MSPAMTLLLLTFGTWLGCNTPVHLEGDPPDEAVALELPPPPTRGRRLEVEGPLLQPGEEIELCRYLNVGNDEVEHVNTVALYAPPGLHHSIVNRLPAEAPDRELPCFGFPDDLDQIAIPIFATSTQVSADVVQLPDGVAFELGVRQQLLVNYHFLNTGKVAMRPRIVVDLHEIEPAEVQSRAGFYAFMNFDDIRIPPHGSQRLTMTCPFWDPALVVTATPHTHQRGKRFLLRKHDGIAPAETLIDTNAWYDPDTVRFEPEVLLSDGQGLTVTCEWENDSDETIEFGETSRDEMCFVFGFFYPADIDILGSEGLGCTVDENVVTEGGLGG